MNQDPIDESDLPSRPRLLLADDFQLASAIAASIEQVCWL